MTYKHLLIGICTVFCFVPEVQNIEIGGIRTTINTHEIAKNLSIVSNIIENLLQTYTAIVIKTGDPAYAEYKIKKNFTIVSSVLESLKKKNNLVEKELSNISNEIARRAGKAGPRAFKGTTMSLSQELRALEKGDLDEVNENSIKPQALKNTMSLSEELEELLKRRLHKKKDKPQAFNGTAMYLSEELVKRYLDKKKEKFTKPQAFKGTTMYLSEELEGSVKRHLDKKKDKFIKPQAFKGISKYVSEELERHHLDKIEFKSTKPQAFKGTKINLSDKFKAEETSSVSQELEGSVKRHLDKKKEKFTKPQAFKGTTMYLSEELEGSVKRHLDKKKDKFIKPQAFKGISKYVSEELERHHLDKIEFKSTKPQAFKGTKINLSDKFKAEETSSVSQELEGSVKRHLDKKKDKFTKPQAFKDTTEYLSEELEVLERRYLDEIEVKSAKSRAFKGTKMNLSDKFKVEETSNLDAMININNKKHEDAIIHDSEENLTGELIIDCKANDKSLVKNLCKSKLKTHVNDKENNEENQKNKSDLWLIHGGKQSSPSSRESTINFKSKVNKLNVGLGRSRLSHASRQKTYMKTEDVNGSVEDQSLEKIIKHAVYLRDSYKDVCNQVVIRQCFRALRAVLKSVCSRGKSCKSQFKDKFRSNGQDECTKKFNNKKAECRMGLDDFGNEAESFSKEVKDLKYRKSHNHTSAKTPEVNVLRDRFEKLCQKSKYKNCLEACNQATNKTCCNNNCGNEKKKAFKKSCKRFCKIHMKYKGSTSDSDDDDLSDDSDSDDDDDDSDK